MATLRYTWNAAAIAEIWKLTIGGTLEVGDIFKVTINGKAWTYTAATTVIATERDSFVTAWNAIDQAAYPEFRELLASAGSGSGDVTLTGITVGIPFTITAATTEAGGGAADAQTFTATLTTAATGPEWWDNVNNWSTGAIPVSTDTVIIDDSTENISYGLAQSAVTLAELNIGASFRGQIGLQKNNPNGYSEYRATYLAIGATSLRVGTGVGGSGPTLLKINTGTVQTAIDVSTTGSSSSSGIPAFLWKGTNANNTLSLAGGSMGVSFYTGDGVSTLKTVNVTAARNQNTTLIIGEGCTLNGAGSVFSQAGGSITCYSSLLTVTRNGGEFTLWGAAAITTLNNQAGQFYFESTGTIATVENTGEFRRESRLEAGNVTLMKTYKDSTVVDANGKIAWTNFDFIQCNQSQLREFNLGQHKRITVTSAP
jgi:hypothetical protein